MFRASLSRKCPGIAAWFRVDSGTNQFKAGKYVIGKGGYLNVPYDKSNKSVLFSAFPFLRVIEILCSVELSR